MGVGTSKPRAWLGDTFQSANRPLSQGVEPHTTGQFRAIGRRAIVAAVLAAQLVAVVAAYDNNHRQFGFQMFPESSRWRAEVVRVDVDGDRTPLEEGWEYRWSDLVRGRGLTNPFTWHHADSGLRGQLDFFETSLQWVSENTPADGETLYLEAQVTYLDNGRGPVTVTYRSLDRSLEHGTAE